MKLSVTSAFLLLGATLPTAFADDIYLIATMRSSRGGSRMPGSAGCINYAEITISKIFKCHGWTFDTCTEEAMKTGAATVEGTWTNGYRTGKTPNGMDLHRNGRTTWAKIDQFRLDHRTWPAICGLGYESIYVEYSAKRSFSYLG